MKKTVILYKIFSYKNINVKIFCFDVLIYTERKCRLFLIMLNRKVEVSYVRTITPWYRVNMIL